MNLNSVLKEVAQWDNQERLELIVQVGMMMKQTHSHANSTFQNNQDLLASLNNIASLTPDDTQIQNRDHDIYLYGQT